MTYVVCYYEGEDNTTLETFVKQKLTDQTPEIFAKWVELYVPAARLIGFWVSDDWVDGQPSFDGLMGPFKLEDGSLRYEDSRVYKANNRI